MLQAEKNQLIEQIFSKKDVFEKYVLNVSSNSDRIEVMDILAKKIVRILLKEELNFLYMKNLDDFKLSLIVNLLFHEIAKEWASFAQETLGFSSDAALVMIQDKERVVYLVSLVKEYFKQYKVYFAQEIADTFIELIENMPSATVSNDLIESVLHSGFVRSGNVAVVYNYGQLWSRVHHAHDFKKDKLTKLQIKLADATLKSEIKKYEYQEALLEEKPLAFFDEAILRLRNTMIQHMMHIDSLKPTAKT